MKNTQQTIGILAALALSPFAFAEKPEKADDHAEHAGHDHGDEDKDHDDHAHAKKAGPNGGRILTEVEPHAEFFVTKDRKVQITFLDKDDKAVAPGDQTVAFIGGKRSAPIKLTFKKTATSFLSEEALPAGNNIPAVISIKADGKKARARFNINLDDCPSCDYKEYACICDHGEGEGDDHAGHDHGDKDKDHKDGDKDDHKGHEHKDGEKHD
jgi:hypothetical protein